MPEKTSPLFSIITVSYNAESTIERTIKSVMDQSFKDFEYIIVDGGSSDKTLELIERYKEFIDIVISESDEGIFDAMNKGIRLASGKMIGLLNSDDWYEPDTLELVANACKESDGKTIFHGLCKYIDHEKEERILSYHHDVLPLHSIAHPTCFIPKVIYDEYGLYDTSFEIAADYDLLLKLYLAGVSFRRIERVLTNFRMGGITSRMNSKYEDLRIHKNHGLISPVNYYLKRWKYILIDLIS